MPPHPLERLLRCLQSTLPQRGVPELSLPRTHLRFSHLLSASPAARAACTFLVGAHPWDHASFLDQRKTPAPTVPSAARLLSLKQPTPSHPPEASGLHSWAHRKSPSERTPAHAALTRTGPWASQSVRSLAGGGPLAGDHPVSGELSSVVGVDHPCKGERSGSGTAGTAQRWRVPVLIVGAGPVGLTLSFLLSKLGVRSLVVERSHSLTRHPQAHLINNRTMELFRHMDGLHDEVVRWQPPVHQWRAFVYCTGLLEEPLLGTVDHFQGQPMGLTLGDTAAASPTSVGHFSQHRLLPLLLRRALDAGAPLWRIAGGTTGEPSTGHQEAAEQGLGVAGAQGGKDRREQAEMSSARSWGAGAGPGAPVLFGWQCTGLEACAEGVQVSVCRSRPPPAQGSVGTPSGSLNGMQQTGKGGEDAPDLIEKMCAGDGGEDSAVIESEYVVGCDGASSGVRGWLGVQMEGDPCLQRLVSVHFRSAPLGSRLLNMGRPGMLYFVFNADVIAVIVAHSLEEGEFVAQIPYFPPAQDAKDFTPQECARLIRAALGSKAPSPPLPLEVLSVRPWTMSAQVASSFVAPAPWTQSPPSAHPSQAGRALQPGRVILAGDAAHRFPPAGGFGMNTGIQDAHNLAWKLAAVLSSVSSPRLLHTYHAERWEVARANCALSISNFYSAMGVATALGLDPRAPRLLQQALESLPVASLVPSSARAGLMQQALAAGRAQLSPWLLSPWNPLGALRLEAARAILRDGRSLQLLFPRHDLGFRYKQGAALETKSAMGRGDGAPEGREKGAAEQWSPFQAVVGGRLPHHPFVAVDLQADGGSARIMTEALMSSHDLQSPYSLASTLIVSSLPASLASWLTQLAPVVQRTLFPVRLAIVAPSAGEVEAAWRTISSQLASQQHRKPTAEAPEGHISRHDPQARGTPLWQLVYYQSSKPRSEEVPEGTNGSGSAQVVGTEPVEVQHKAAQRPLPVCMVLDAGVQLKHTWWRKIGVPSEGAVLVRPDGHIAWCKRSAEEGSSQLLLALQDVYRPWSPL